MRKRNKIRSAARSAALLAGFFAVFQATGWAQCVMCGTALASSPEGRALASSFRYGIVILMFAPYLILGSIGYAIFRAYRKRRSAVIIEGLHTLSRRERVW